MSPFRPDLVEVWVFRDRSGASSPASAEKVISVPSDTSTLEILMMRRSPGRILSGLWQCVSGSLETGESVAAGALRELREETGFGAPEILGFYDLDQVNQFHEPSVEAILSSAVFAVRVGSLAEAVLSDEHDDGRWVSLQEALRLAVWPAYRESIGRIVDNLLDPERAIWFELTIEGARPRR